MQTWRHPHRNGGTTYRLIHRHRYRHKYVGKRTDIGIHTHTRRDADTDMVTKERHRLTQAFKIRHAKIDGLFQGTDRTWLYVQGSYCLCCFFLFGRGPGGSGASRSFRHLQCTAVQCKCLAFRRVLNKSHSHSQSFK